MSPYTHTNLALTPVPYSCDTCRQSGSPNAMLVFPVNGEYPVPECRYHKEPIPMTRSIHYDANGNKLQEVQ